ncbi:MAG: hypothetical protein M3Y85_08165 [Bacteroidota bacterium]|nr:hypothetical protein [Bacteroidota bacterium]
MKQSLKLSALRSFFFVSCLTLFNVLVWAQESTDNGGTKSTTSTSTKSTDINLTTNNGNDNWYTQPWVWIVGAAVFILLLVALLSNSKKTSTTSDRITVKKSVERDSGSDV